MNTSNKNSEFKHEEMSNKLINFYKEYLEEISHKVVEEAMMRNNIKWYKRLFKGVC